MKPGFRDINWVAFCHWATKHKATTSVDTFDGITHLYFEGGAEAIVQSNYDGPCSSITPGSGIEPPTVSIKG